MAQTDLFNGVEVKTELLVRRVAGVWEAKVSLGGLTDVSTTGFATKAEALAWAITVAA